jgi:hypothetical protein
MGEKREERPRESDVAMWHRLSGLPDNVTDEGLVVHVDEARRQQAAKDALRAEIAHLAASGLPQQVHSAARLAASYLLAGDAETARRRS